MRGEERPKIGKRVRVARENLLDTEKVRNIHESSMKKDLLAIISEQNAIKLLWSGTSIPQLHLLCQKIKRLISNLCAIKITIIRFLL